MNNIANVYNNDIFGKLTVITIDDKIYFIAKELAEKLEYSRTESLTKLLNQTEIKYASEANLLLINNLPFTIPERGLNLITESGLYHAVFKSSKPEAENFRFWVTEEVLPSIRKTGGYKLNTFDIPKTFGEALQLAAKLQIELESKQIKIEKLEDKIKLDQPKVEFIDNITSENSKLTISDYAKLLSEENDIIIGPNKLFDYLRSAEYFMEGRNSREKNKPYQKYIENGYFIVEYVKTNVGTRVQPLITLKGQIELSDQILAYFSK